MVDILFNESAAGGLKFAQQYGKGKYKEPMFFAVVALGKDGHQPTPEEEARARQQAIEHEKAAWRQAEPISGKASDIFCFPLALQLGDISELLPGEKRARWLEKLTADIPPADREYVGGIVPDANKKLEKIHNRIEKEQEIRVWYSNNPEEYMGLLWICAWLDSIGKTETKIHALQLPQWADTPYGKVNYNGWGEVRHEYWHKLYTPVLLQAVDIKMYANEWKKLAEENSPLRAILNGHIHSVPEDFYDFFITAEIKNQPEEFMQAQVIGKVLGKYHLGITTGFIFNRMEKMMEDGLLTPVTQAENDRPLYHRKMKRNF